MASHLEGITVHLCLGERRPNKRGERAREGESNHPENVSYTMLIQGVLSKMRSAQWATGPLIGPTSPAV
jgi:hypothetical protein